MLNAYMVPHPPLLVPGVGHGGEIPDTRRAFELISNELIEQDAGTLIIISPHSVLYDDYIHIAPGAGASGDFGAFRARGVKLSVQYDQELAELIGSIARAKGIPAGPLGEKIPSLDHGVMVPLYFLKAKKIVRISLSGFSLEEHYRFGMCIAEAIRSLPRNAAVVASGDMSHKLKQDGPYGFAPQGPEHDAFVCECIKNADFRKLLKIEPTLRERAAECGLRSLVILAGTLDGMRVESRLLNYEGPYGVGYLCAAFRGFGESESLLPMIRADRRALMKKTREAEDSFVRLARNNAENFVRTGEYIALPNTLPPEMLNRRAGVFVSIKKDGTLRGCIGTTSPTQDNIAMEIIRNSAEAACGDPRFDPVSPGELDELTYSVDILSSAEPIDGPEKLDPERYGVIVSHGYKRGLLLPNLEGVDTVEEQISIALRKAGINPRAPYALERFTVVRHK